MSDEINIKELPLNELPELMMDDLYDGYADEVVEEVEEALSRHMEPYDVLTKGLVAGMDIVGLDFRDGVLFVPEALMAAKAMKAGMAVLRPLLAETGVAKTGTMVIGAVKGDIRDIGKNLVAMMMEGAGFEVINLGVNNDVDNFLSALEEHRPDILGMSALLTTTMPYMRIVIDALIAQGIRQDYIVLVGGAPSMKPLPKILAPTPTAATPPLPLKQPKNIWLSKESGERIANRRVANSFRLISPHLPCLPAHLPGSARRF